jgi:hypothetical protein
MNIISRKTQSNIKKGLMERNYTQQQADDVAAMYKQQANQENIVKKKKIIDKNNSAKINNHGTPNTQTPQNNPNNNGSY